ncbi:MAG: LytR/AlgR family response regulator transcription factor, partial [Saprospiraceae bacterium]
HRLKLDDILYIEGMAEYVAFHTRSSGRLLSLMSLKQLEGDLPADRFLRIHKSYIVASAHVSVLEGNQVVIGKVKLPLGASYREEVLRRVF